MRLRDFFKSSQTLRIEKLERELSNKLELQNKVESLENNLKSYNNEFGIFIRQLKHAGQNVNTNTALGLATYYACVRDKAESIGQLPGIVKRNGVILTRGQREYKILTQKPNDYMTLQDLLEFFVTTLETKGNFYAYPVFNRYGNLTELIPLRYQGNVNAVMDTNGRVYYTYTTNDGKPMTVFAGSELLHVKLNSLDGLNGLSPVSTVARTYGVAIAQDVHVESLMNGSAVPKGVLTTEHTFNDDTKIELLKKQWKEVYGGASNSGNTPVLENGLKYQATGLSPADTQLLEQRQFTRVEICGILRVPPSRIGITTDQKFKTLEEVNKAYLRDSLMPLIVKFENMINDVLPDNLTFKINDKHFARGDRASQVESLAKEFSLGAISINEFRKDLDRDELDGGDVHAIDTNNLTFGRLTDIGSMQSTNQENEGEPDEEDDS